MRSRLVAFRAAIVFATTFILTLGFGIIDYVAGFFPRSTDPKDTYTNVMSTGYGTLAAILLPVALASQWRGSARWLGLFEAGSLAVAAMAVAAALANDYRHPFVPVPGAWGNFVGLAVVAVPVALVGALHPQRGALFRGAGRPHRAVLLFALASAAAWAVYGVAMSPNQWRAVEPLNGERNGYGAWTGLCGMALAFAAVGVHAAWRRGGWRAEAWTLAAAAGSFGAVVLLHPHAPGSLGTAGGALVVAWSVAWAAWGTWPGRRAERPALFNRAAGDA